MAVKPILSNSMASSTYSSPTHERTVDPRKMRPYELIRTNPIDFSFKNSRSVSTPKKPESYFHGLKRKIKDLQEQLRILDQKLHISYKTNSSLKEELEKMKDFNRKLLSNRIEESNGDSHYMVQQLLITEANTKVSVAQNEIDKFRLEAKRQKERVGLCKDNTKKLEGVVKQYRKMLGDTLASQRKQARTSLDFNSELPILKSNKATPKPKTSFKNNIVYTLNYLQALLYETNLKEVFRLAVAACKAMTGCGHCTLFVMNKDLQKDYAAHFTEKNPAPRVIIGSAWVSMHTDPEAVHRDPLFSKAEEVGRGVIGADHILYPVLHKKELMLIVQCEGIKRPIEHIDEVLLKLALAGLSHALNHFLGVKAQKQLKFFIDRSSECMSAIAASRSHQAFSNAIYNHFPRLFGFQGAAVVYVQESTHEFFANSPSGDEERFAYELIKYPSTLGICAKMVTTAGAKAFEDIKKTPNYCSDLDNLCGNKNAKDAVFCRMEGTESVVGILILTNRLSSVVQDNFGLIEHMCQLLGSFVSGINDTFEAMELTVRMRSFTAELNHKIQQELGMPPKEMAKLGDLLQIMNTRVSFIDRSIKGIKKLGE